MRNLIKYVASKLEIISLYIAAVFIFLVMGFGFAGNILLGFGIAFSLGFGWLAVICILFAVEKQYEIKDHKKSNL